MKDKLIQANGNIQELILQIIELNKSEMANYCVGNNDKCTNECEKCKIKYFHKSEEDMLKKYIVV